MHPPQGVQAPIVQVTLLEDRASVRRRIETPLAPGLHRLRVDKVAVVLQDVSLYARSLNESVKVVDVRVKRESRVRTPKEDWAQLREEERRLETQRLMHVQSQARAQARYDALTEVARCGVNELPVDAAWGIAHPQVWRNTFQDLTQRQRDLRKSILEHHHAQKDVIEELKNLHRRQAVVRQPGQVYEAWLELDVEAVTEETAEVLVEYIVPNALWRPRHIAALEDGRLSFSSLATVWQNTGEDWTDAELVFSTARTSQDTEPPLLDDDELTTEKKKEETRVEAREVKVQRAKVKGGSATEPSSDLVDLPGVDDGGEVRLLKSETKVSVPSDGRPVFVPVGRFDAPAMVQLVVYPELHSQVFVRVVSQNEGPGPILAGPVELIKNRGTVGFTDTLFVSVKETFELGFGSDDGVSVSRTRSYDTDDDREDRWRVTTHEIACHLSNLSGTGKTIVMKERIPVSEIESVRVEVDSDRTTDAPEPDADGILEWTVELDPRARKTVELVWRMRVASGVQGV